MEGWYTDRAPRLSSPAAAASTPPRLEAAAKSKAYVVGVYVDQHYIGEKAIAENGYNPFVIRHEGPEGSDDFRADQVL